MIPEHYSPTAMFCYHECHRKYYLKYVEKIQVPLSVRLLEGDLFHERIAGASRELVAKLFNERKRHYTFPAKDSDASILGGIETALGDNNDMREDEIYFMKDQFTQYTTDSYLLLMTQERL